MLFRFFKCPKCSERDFSPNFDESLDAFMKEYDCSVISEFEGPTKIPDYLIFKCINPECKYSCKYTHKEIIEKITQGWAMLAWKKSQQELKNSVNFDGYLTKYILDNTLHKFISQKDLDNNKILKDYINTVKKNEAKLNTKS